MKIKNLVKRVQSKIPVVAFTLATLSPCALAQDRLGNGGEASNRVLRDLIDNTVCNWVLAEALRSQFSSELTPILEKIRDAAIQDGKLNLELASLASGLSRDLSKMTWCQTEAPLYRVDTHDENSVITEFKGATTQLAVRVNDKVFLDMVQFRKLDSNSQALLLIHEALHELINSNELGHNGQIRSLTKSIASFAQGKIDRESFLFQIKTNGIRLQSPESIAQEFVKIGISPKILIQVGIQLSDLKNGGITARQLRGSGVTAQEILAMSPYVNSPYPVEELIKGGYPALELREAGFSAHYFFACESGCISMAEAKKAGFTVREALNHTRPLFYRTLYSNLKTAYTSEELRNGFGHISAYDAYGATITDALNDGMTPVEICSQGYCSRLRELLGLPALKKAGVPLALIRNENRYLKLSEYFASGYSRQEVLDETKKGMIPFHPQMMKAAGYSVSELRATGNAKYKSAAYMVGTGYTNRELIAGGFRWLEIKRAENNPSHLDYEW